jgi:plasmid replication initiation protein
MTEKNLPAQSENNTLETLGVTPRFILKRNAVIRAAYSLSATAQKITAMAMSLLPKDLSNLTVSFTFGDFCKALGFEKGGKSYKIFSAAVMECMKCVITVETEHGRTRFQWFNLSKENDETGQVTMRLSEELAEVLREMEWVYTKLYLRNIGKLQSGYAVHLYEILESHRSLAGKGGNKPGSWYVENPLDTWRFLLGVPKDAYSETKYFKQFVIDGPIKEINNVNVGIKCKAESVKQGRKVVGYRVNCESDNPETSPAPAKKRGRPRKNPDASLPTAVPAQCTDGAKETLIEKENAHLVELYPKEYAALFAEAFKKHSEGAGALISEAMRLTFAASDAFAALRERHGVVK